MGAIGKKLRRSSGANGYVALLHWCPGCDEPHGIQIGTGPGPKWTFNGDYDAPSFSPSVLCFTTETTDDDDNPLPAPIRRTLCHYFIKRPADMGPRGAGLDPAKSYIDFCGDSPHA